MLTPTSHNLRKRFLMLNFPILIALRPQHFPQFTSRRTNTACCQGVGGFEIRESIGRATRVVFTGRFIPSFDGTQFRSKVKFTMKAAGVESR